MSIAQWMRDKYLNDYNIDTSNFSDEQLIFKYGQELENKGLNMSDMYQQHGEDFTDSYYDIKNRAPEGRGLLDETGLGFTRGLEGEKGMYTSALGLGAGIVGLDGIEESLLDKSSQYQQKAAQSEPSVGRASDVRWDKPEEVARFLMGAVGEVVPSVFSSALSGGVGAIAGRTVASQMGKRALRKSIEGRVDKSIAEAVKDVGKEVIKQNARKGLAVGGSIGLGANSFGLGMGEIYSELYQYTQLDPSDKDYVDPTEARAIAVGFGSLSGSLDFLSAGTILGKLIGTPKEVASDYLKRLVRNLPEGVILEGGTEAAQEFINIAADKYARNKEFDFSSQELSRLFDAGVLGAVGGSQFSAISAIKGPKTQDRTDDSDIITPENEVENRQKPLYDYLKKQRSQLESRYAVGDEVEIALSGSSGFVTKVTGNNVEVKLHNGEIARTTMDKLTAAIEPEEQIDEEPIKETLVLEEEGEAPKVAQDVLDTIMVKPTKPEQGGEQSLSIRVGEGDVRTKDKLTKQQVEDARELYDTLLDLSQKDMSKNTSYANKTGGFAGNVQAALISRMGEEKYKRLWTPKNLQVLRDLGIIDYSNQWKLGTRFDNEYDKKIEDREIQSRVNFLSREKIGVDTKVIIKETGDEVTVESIDENGMVKVTGVEEPLFPKQLKKKKEPRILSPRPRANRQKPAEGVFEKESDEQDETPPDPVFSLTDNEFIPRFDLKDKGIGVVYTTGNKPVRRQVHTDLFKNVNDTASFSEALRTWVNNTQKNKRGFSKVALDTLKGIEIDGQIHGIEIHSDYIYASGLKIPTKERVNLDNNKGSIPFNIFEMSIDDGLMSDLDQAVDLEDSTPEGDILRKDADELNLTRSAVLLRKAGESEDSYLLVSLVVGKKAGGVKVLKGWDPYKGKSGAAINLKGGTEDNYSGYEVIGKLVSEKPIGKVFLYYDSLDEFNADSKVSKFRSLAQAGTKAENKAASQALTKEEEEVVESEIEELEAVVNEPESAPTGDTKDASQKLKELRQTKKKSDKAKKKVSKINEQDQKVLDDYRLSIDVLADMEKAYRAKENYEFNDGSIRVPASKDIKDQEDAVDFARSKVSKIKINTTKTGKPAFLEDAVTDVSDASINESVANTVAEETSTASNAAMASENESFASGLRGGKKEAQVDIEVSLAGKSTIPFLNLPKKTLTNLIVSYNNQTIRDFQGLLEMYIEEKKAQGEFSDSFISKLNDFIVKFYDTFAGKAFSKIQKGKDSFFDSFQEIIDGASRSENNAKRALPIIKAYQEKILSTLELFDQKSLLEKIKQKMDFIGQAKQRLKNPQYMAYEIVNLALKDMGFDDNSPIQKSLLRVSMEIKEDAANMTIDDVITHINKDKQFDSNDLLERLADIYEADLEEESGFPFFTKDGQRFNYIQEDLRSLVNFNYNRQIMPEEVDAFPMGNKFTDPLSEARIDPSSQHIPNKIDPTTGRVHTGNVIVLDEASAKASIDEARASEQNYMAPLENPLEKVAPELVDSGIAAMKSFAPGGIGQPFRLSVAINQIRNSNPKITSIGNVARLLDSKALDGYMVEFMDWENFRPFASPKKGVLNKSVILPSKKKIIISTAYNNNPKYSAKDVLMAEIIHEAVHAVTKPALDLGYAYATDNKKLIKELGDPNKFNSTGAELARIFTDINEKLLPYLREKGSLDQLYGLASIDEFFSELASDAEFQKFLKDTPLPDSLKEKRTVLQTVFDYILAILSKLGLRSSSIDASALDYARSEMAKLLEVSNGVSELNDKILKANARSINSLASRLDTNNIEKRYDELLERFSETTLPEGEGSIINEINALVKGSTSSEQTPSERRIAESKALRQYARKSGKEVSLSSFLERLEEAEIFGGEHEVYFDEAEMRFYKAHRGEDASNPSVRSNTSEYLQRLILHNTIFPESAYRVEGILSSPELDISRVVVSQEAVIGEDPSQAQIDDHMSGLGFTKVDGYDKPLYRLGDIQVWDVRPGNAYIVDGSLVVFDPQIERVTEANKNAERLATFVSGDSTKRAMIEKLIDETTDIDDLVGLMDEMDTMLGNQFTPPNDIPISSNTMPDDNARVMAQANAAGFNEMIEEMIKVHREVGDKLDININDFLNLYGKPGRKNVTKIRQLLKKDLGAFDIDPDGIRIEDAGLNSVSRAFGTRKAVSNLERVRENARKNKSSTSILIESIENTQIENKRMYEDLLKGRIPPRDKLAERFSTRLKSVSFEKLQEYVNNFPNSGMSQADLNKISEITNDQVMDVLDFVAEARGEIDSLKKDQLLEILERSPDTRLASIKGDQIAQKVKRFAMVRAIKDSRDVLSILRLSKGLVGGMEQDFKNAATMIAMAKSEEAVDAVEFKFPGTQGTPLKHFAKMKKAELQENAVLEKEKAQLEVYDLIDRSLGDRSARLRMALGELEPVNIYDGVTLVTLEKDSKEPSGWRKGTYKVKIKNGKLEDRDNFIKVNKNTLTGLRDEKVLSAYGNEPWWEIMKEQANLALTEPILDEHFHAQRAAWFSGLQGLTERMSKLGYEGKKLAQMSTRTVALYRDYATKSLAYSKQFNTAFHKVMQKLKLGGNELYSGLYQDIFWWLDNHPEYAGKEDEGFRKLWSHLQQNANIPDRTLLDDEAKKLTRSMINKAIIARDWEAEVNRRLGNRVRDEEIKVESFVNQEMVDFYRLPMEMGFATMPRTLNDAVLRETNRIMEKAGWHTEESSGLLEEAAKAKDEQTMDKIYKNLFTDEVIDRFVKPFTNTDVRQSVFRGPRDADDHRPAIGNSFINEAFKASNGDMLAMSNYIFDRMATNPSPKSRLEWQHGFLKQFFSRYKQIRRVAVRVSKEKNGMHSGESMRNTPQSLDARMVESRLPKEFFYYNMYDEVSSNIRLALMTATASFGRNGEYANRARLEGVNNLDSAAGTFNELMSRATKSRHEKPRATYSRSVKAEAYRLLKKDGYDNPEKAWNDLYTKSIAHGEFMVVFDQLGKYYGRDNVAGPYQDANLLLEILGAQSIQVLNNPKSSFWQALALFEFPNAFRGLNKIAGKATASALGNFVNQTVGGIGEAMGMQLERTGRYAQYLNNTHFRLDEMDLPFKEYNSMVGSGGDLAESIKNRPALGLKGYIRTVKNIATHHRRKNKDGTRAPIDPLTLITGIFPYINNVVNHSVGVGAIHTYSDLVLQIAEVIEQRGLTDYQEFSAKDLGMGDKAGEWVIGEEDGYNRANELLVSAGGPTLSRLAFDYVDRKKSDKNAMPIDRNMALVINQVAMNSVAGEGFNSKPAWLYTSPTLKYFSTFLGWPLGKMSRDLQFIFRDPSDRVGTYKALLKYVALMSSVYVPVGLSFAMLIDWYDEEMLEKPNNLPPISPWAALPVLGIPLAMRDENFTLYSVTSRMAKAGVPFGMGMDLLNGLFAKGDPYGAARELSLDSRIFAWSMFKNIYDAIGTWIHAGEFDWQMVGRPIAYGVGGNSVIQMMDLTTALLDIDSEERRVADYIGMRNHIKKTAFLMGLPLRPPNKGGQMPTAVSINTRQMARAAFAGDTEDFLIQYQEALEAAKKYLDERGRTDDPAKYVADAFKGRDIRSNITAGKISDEDWESLKAILPEDARMKIESAIQAHEHYLKLIGGKRRTTSKRTRMNMREARMRALLL